VACARDERPTASPSPADRGAAEAIRALIRPLDAALAAFETAVPSGEQAEARARRALLEAMAARDALESLRVTPALAAARREELIYVNHVVPAFQEYLARPPDPTSRERLRVILRRGRAHEALGREAMAAAGAGG
jgi:hypothetical protein